MATCPSLPFSASASQIASLIRTGKTTATEVTRACLKRIEELDSKYGAFVTVLSAHSLEQANRADADSIKGKIKGPLHGFPINVKDTFVMEGAPTTVGSQILRGYSPSGQEATCIQKLREAGAIILGKTNVGSANASPDNPRLS